MTEKEIIDRLPELLALPKETEWVEFKHNNHRASDIGEYISALSNSACLHKKEKAFLVFGVESGTHKVLGTDFNPKTEKVGNEELENWLTHLLDPRIDFKIFMLRFQDKPVVVVSIDPACDRPVKFSGSAYIRVGSYKKKLSEHPEKERKIWDRTGSNSFEQGIANEGIAEEKVLSMLDWERYFKLMKIPAPANPKGIIEALKNEKFIIQRHASFSITNLGAILFARELGMFETLARKSVRVIQYQGKNRLNTIKEQVGARGYASGFQGLVAYINQQLPVNEVIEKALRKEVKMYPDIAVRELVANALIHQDFSEKGTGSTVEIFEDRIEITNPGKPLIEPLRFIDHPPQSRNEKIAHFMRRATICEERGSGIDKVVYWAEVFQLPAPDFIQENNFLKAVMYSHKTLQQMDKNDKIRAAYQHCCLKYVSNERMTNQSLRERFKVAPQNYSTVSRIIADAIQGKLIKEYDPTNKSRKYAKYVPIWA